MRRGTCGALLALFWLLAVTVWLSDAALEGGASMVHAGVGMGIDAGAGTRERIGAEGGARADVGRASRADAGGVDLGAYRWKRRLLLVFAPSAGAAEYVRQEGLLAGHRAQLADRDVTEGGFFLRGRGHLGAASISATAAAALRMQLGVAGDRFTVLLIGKDGGIKLTLARPVGAAELIAVIDAMPMRRAGLR